MDETNSLEQYITWDCVLNSLMLILVVARELWMTWFQRRFTISATLLQKGLIDEYSKEICQPCPVYQPCNPAAIMVDISLTVSQIFILIVAIVTAVLSIFAHADTLTVILRQP